MTFKIALVGCGGMGRRHAHGYIELRKYFDTVEMTAVCDVYHDVAATVASEIGEATGSTPDIYTDFGEMLAQADLDGVAIVTSTPMHHIFAIKAMNTGLHVITEKPMGLTLKACRQMREVSQSTGKVMAVAENYRRDPMNRLTRALIQAGAIGTPYFVLDIGVGSSDGAVMHSTVWRAKKEQAGGAPLDAGVHNADMLLYLMGGANTVYAETAINETQRTLRPMIEVAPVLAEMYDHRKEDGYATGDIVEQTAADTAFGLIRFNSGAIGQLLMTDTSHGQSLGVSTISGSTGTMYRPRSRSGESPRIVRNDGSEITGDALLELVPDFELDDTISILWNGARRISSYDMDFRNIDSKILAYEYLDMVQAAESGGQLEVGPQEGMDALALAYALMESGVSGAPVTVEDVAEGRVSAFQDEIDASMGI
ncbi:MAG: Gfo/Idh/MocA family oxidoreductase [Dehalococcoidia bacterium]|jgi:predicted dehydrogenase|nr:Gfo/Idh/MocA family oxidoreductase [Dehalococcoidia bacterium]MDP7486363.1 Gfo/Idh/MocA family oxidoreductase [Dehalococcoidia bacterium]|tara:strand:- start:977 stop:2251 length:1275 start_codon:yes stop_codon:yes gene_type:complete